MNRSDCPISNALDHLGDKWSLLVIRDIAFFGKRAYNELLHSSEGIATNILSSRLKSLEASCIIKKTPDPSDRRRQIYSLTESGKDLIPVMLEMILWSAKHYSDTLDIPTELVQKANEDRDALINQLMDRISMEE